LIKANGFNLKICALSSLISIIAAAPSFIVDALAAVTVPSFEKQRLRLGFFYFDISELFIFRYYNWISFALWNGKGLLRYQIYLLPKLSLNAHTIELRTYLGLL
jgi:hypothetical protein